MQRKKSFVVVLAALVFGPVASAQISTPQLVRIGYPSRGVWYPLPGPRLLADPAVTSARTLAAQVFQAPHLLPIPPDPTDPTGSWFSMHYALQLPMDFYARNMGIACQKEWKFEKATGIPLRIRLGSLEQCDRLEGK